MIALSPQTEKLLEEKLISGAFRTVDEVVQAALAALDASGSAALSDHVLNAIDRSEDQIDAGEVHDWNDVRDKVRNAFGK